MILCLILIGFLYVLKKDYILHSCNTTFLSYWFTNAMENLSGNVQNILRKDVTLHVLG
jgi:hypothetical protein